LIVVLICISLWTNSFHVLIGHFTFIQLLHQPLWRLSLGSSRGCLLSCQALPRSFFFQFCSFKNHLLAGCW
jgi:hypothetical protein